MNRDLMSASPDEESDTFSDTNFGRFCSQKMKESQSTRYFQSRKKTQEFGKVNRGENREFPEPIFL